MRSWSSQNSDLCQVLPMIPSLPSVYLQFQPLPGALVSDTYLLLNISTWIFKMHLKLNMCKATSGCPPPPWLPNLSPSLKCQHHPSRCLCPKYLELSFDSFLPHPQQLIPEKALLAPLTKTHPEPSGFCLLPSSSMAQAILISLLDPKPASIGFSHFSLAALRFIL